MPPKVISGGDNPYDIHDAKLSSSATAHESSSVTAHEISNRQSKGLTVIPTVSWSTPASYSYSFDGIEKGAIVAIGMIGCKKNKSDFMHGYNTMLERIQPEAIICFGNPFSEMTGNLITVDYCASRKAVR